MALDQQGPRVIVNLCGDRKSLPFSEAHRKLWEVDLGWVLILDWYRSGHGESAMSGHVSEQLTKPAGHFLREMLTRATRSVTIDDRCFRNEADRPPTRGQFTGWACRAGKLSPSKECFRVQTESGFDGSDKAYGYVMRYDVTWLLVMEPDNTAGFGPGHIPWACFLAPPE